MDDEYEESAVPPPQWKSGNWLRDYFRRFDELHIDKELRLEHDIDNLRSELNLTKASFDSPDRISALRDEMHHWRREAESLSAKLKQAEAFIEKQTQTIEENNVSYKDLMRRCKELEQNPING
jgi:chromosome segregation ATPase